MAKGTQFETSAGVIHTPGRVHATNGHLPGTLLAPYAMPADAQVVDFPAVSDIEDTFVLPASREQTRYWMLAQLDPQSTASNMAISFEIEGELSLAAAEQAIAALTMRHESLRTIFRLENGVLSQVVLTRPLYRFTIEDLSGVDAADQPRAIEAAVSQHGHTVIDLHAGPVLHARLIQLSPRRHIMALTMNHIVCDGWSNGLLIRDFTVLYEALAGNKEPVLPELPFQFADFSLWQNEYLQSPAAEEAAGFWKAHITSDLSALDLPTDQPRPPGRSFPGHIESALLPQAIDEKLKAYCRKTGSTKHIVLLAAFEALCARYTGQEAFLLGSTIANRTQPGMEDVVGRFANPQIIVANVAGDPTFAALEQRVREWEMAAYTHQDLPFSRIIEDFQIDQAGATSQFLQVWFLYQKAFMQPQAGETVHVTPRRSVSGGVDFDLLVSVVERAEGPRIQFEYNTLIFEPARIQGLIQAFIRLLGEALDQPGLALSQIAQTAFAPASPFVAVPGHAISLLNRDGSTHQTAPTGMDANTDDCMPGILVSLADHLLHKPEAVAFSDPFSRISWRQLEKQSSAVACKLIADRNFADAGSALDAIVIHLTSHIESAVALLAAVKAGVRIVPLPEQAGVQAVTACLAQFANAALLGPRRTIEQTAGQGRDVAALAFEDFALLDEALALPADVRPETAIASLSSNDVNGSTFLLLTDAGTTRFAEVAASTLFQSVLTTLAGIGVAEGSSVLAFPAVTALDGCLDRLMVFASGAQLHLATDLSVQSLAGQLAEHEVSALLATPPEAKQIFASGWSGDRRVALILRGGRLPAHADAWLPARLRSATYLLAAPQAGGLVACQDLRGAAQALLPIGSATLGLASATGSVLPFGAFGEITVLHADGVNLPTGYMGRTSPDGAVSLMDRKERLIQARGHRVCLGEIEDAVSVLPGVYAASVVAPGPDALVMYLTGARERDTEAVCQCVAQTLPSHLVPSEFVWLDSLPLQADGCLDLDKLPGHDPVLPIPASGEGTSNDVEDRLAAIWKEVLSLKTLDVHTSFFALGGSSLLLVRLFARINKAFDTSLPITTIFDAQTVAKLASVLGGATEMSHIVNVQTGGSKPPLFMIHSYLLYQGLSMHLGADQPFYGLRELEQDGHLTIDDRVHRYVREIRKVQPHGPYHLAGWCAAGPLTVEVGRLLLQSGEKVNYLALFDSWLPGYLETIEKAEADKAWRPYRTVGNKFHYHRNRMRGLSLAKKGLYLWLAVTRSARDARYRIYLHNWQRLHRLSEKYQFALPQFMHNTSLETFSALKEYKGRRLPARLTLIRASDSREVAGAASSCGWEQVAEKGVDVLWAPGDHETMFIGDRLRVTSEIVLHGLESAHAAAQTVSVAEGAQPVNPLLGVMHVDCPST